MKTRPTRESLHAVAELLLAGPQYDASGTIRLRVVPGGFATVAAPDVQVVGGDLLVGSATHLLVDRSINEVAAAAGLAPRPLGDVYTDATTLDPGTPLVVEPTHALEIADALWLGDAALAAFAPDVDRVLWPEHFDLGISLDEVNYGISPGDAYLDKPYAYVGPWQLDGLADSDGPDPFWNAPFGAAAPLHELGDAAGIAAYFARGQSLTRS